MRSVLRTAAALLSLAFLACLSLPVLAVDPPVTLTQLRTQFSVWDTNKDGHLDKRELARGFRGPNARPYDMELSALDSGTAALGVDRKTASGTSGRLVGLLASPLGPGPLLSATTLLAKMPRKDDKDDPRKGKPDYSIFPDYQFLTQLDKDGDGKISKAEFDTWAREYSTQSKKFHEVAVRISKAEAKLNAAVKSADKKKIETDLRKDREIMDKMTADLKGFEQQLQRTLSSTGK